MNSLAEQLARTLLEKNDKLTELKHVVDACPLATFITDAQGDCVYANAAYQVLVDRELYALKGRGWKKVVHPDDADNVESSWYDAAARSAPFNQSYRFVRPDGIAFPVSCNAVKLPSGGYVGYVSALNLAVRDGFLAENTSV